MPLREGTRTMTTLRKDLDSEFPTSWSRRTAKGRIDVKRRATITIKQPSTLFDEIRQERAND